MDEDKLLNSLFAYSVDSTWQNGTNTFCINKDKTVNVVRSNKIWDREKPLSDSEYKIIEDTVNKYKNDLYDLPLELDDGEYVIMDGSTYEFYIYGRKYITDLAAITSENDLFEITTEDEKMIYKKRRAQVLLNEMLTSIEHIVGFKWADEDDMPDIEG